MKWYIQLCMYWVFVVVLLFVTVLQIAISVDFYVTWKKVLKKIYSRKNSIELSQPKAQVKVVVFLLEIEKI